MSTEGAADLLSATGYNSNKPFLVRAGFSAAGGKQYWKEDLMLLCIFF